MQLAVEPRDDRPRSADGPGFGEIADAVGAELDRRLAREDGAPVLVALSGGGDSVALLLAAHAWAQVAGRRIIAATVDHRLSAQSADWTTACRARSEALGVAHLSLLWEGRRPTAGVPAAARAARHRLLAQAARSVGALVILMGHTADDVIEAALMRDAGATTPSPRAWAPSPVWPDGRELFIHRPLLQIRRATLRRVLTAIGETWIDDPANADPASLRVRARRFASLAPCQPDATIAAPRMPAPFEAGPSGEIWADVPALAAASPEQARAWLGAAILCAAGHSRPPRSASLDRVLGALRSDMPIAATLAGARLATDGGRLLIAREAGDGRAGVTPDLDLRAWETGVWDGRFEVRAGPAPVTLSSLCGRLSRLSKRQQQQVRRLHPLVRRTLPALVLADGAILCAILDSGSGIAMRCLVQPRLAAACGDVDHETAIVAWRSRKAHPKSDG